MKLFTPIALACLLLASVLSAQHRGGGGMAGHAGVAGRGGFRGGNRGGYGHGFRGEFRHRDRDFRFRSYGFAYYWPWYSDLGFWDSPSYDYGYPYYSQQYSAPNVTVVYPPPAEPVNPVVVTQTVRPVIHEYRQPEDYGLPAERQNHPVLYLIAFRDHVIRAALAYWVDGGTVHYLEIDHKEKQAPLSSVDPDFSAELNRERHVPFSLQ